MSECFHSVSHRLQGDFKRAAYGVMSEQVAHGVMSLIPCTLSVLENWVSQDLTTKEPIPTDSWVSRGTEEPVGRGSVRSVGDRASHRDIQLFPWGTPSSG